VRTQLANSISSGISCAKVDATTSCFFQTFGIPVLKGNPKDMIMPGSVFVSEHFAREMG